MARHAAYLVIASATAGALLAMSVPDRAPSASGPTHAAAPLPRALPFFYDLYSFRGEAGMTDVVASFAVPAGNLEHEDVGGSVRYRFNVTLVLADTALGVVSRADDSVFIALDRRLASKHLLHTHVQTRAAPSRTTVQRVVMIDAPYPGTGQLYSTEYEVRDYRGEELMLSDIALGLPGRVGGWKRGNVTLALLPSDHFPSGIFDVYYEVYNLSEGAPYTTEISIEPVTGPGARDVETGRSVRLSFSGESAAEAGDVLPELRRLDASLANGPYRLTVTVTDEKTGRTARRDRLLEVRKWDEGATLVPACPVTPGVTRPDCPDTPRHQG